MNKKIILISLIVLGIFILGYFLFAECNRCIHKPDLPSEIIGGDVDEHGCIATAGYTWCEAKQKCLRRWEEVCEEEQVEDVVESACTKKKFCNTVEDCKYIWWAGGCYNQKYTVECRKEQEAKGLFLSEAPPMEGVVCSCEENKCLTENSE